MEYIDRRTTSYCRVVQRSVKVEFSIFLKKGNLEVCATCTGIEEVCKNCPVIQYNNLYPPATQKRLPPV
ncbi:hypothetical protein SAMN05518683_101114 [Salibacterium halotolerans]|uniref:Uncharacterized protein n=1 Tax=Salibacterium halotolerans TaxID=1884432 RepID=A0A1I5L5U0_9BACI|nr:hypothetical protein SAMN05518683_101114 [Salibacterium halotolerans]